MRLVTAPTLNGGDDAPCHSNSPISYLMLWLLWLQDIVFRGRSTGRDSKELTENMFNPVCNHHPTSFSSVYPSSDTSGKVTTR